MLRPLLICDKGNDDNNSSHNDAKKRLKLYFVHQTNVQRESDQSNIKLIQNQIPNRMQLVAGNKLPHILFSLVHIVSIQSNIYIKKKEIEINNKHKIKISFLHK